MTCHLASANLQQPFQADTVSHRVFRGLLAFLIAIASLGAGHAAHAQSGGGEGEVLEFEVELRSPEGVPVTLAEGEEVITSYGTADGTAKAGLDYTHTTGTLTFTAQEPRPVITVATLEDELNEADEFFIVTVLPADLADGSRTDKLDQTLSIRDNDGLTATLSAERLILEEGEPATFAVQLSGAISTEPVVINYQVAASGTVMAGTDYEEPSGSLTIDTDAESGTFTIKTHDDDLLERDEWLVVQLPRDCCFSAGSVSPPVPAAAPVRVTIRDNDTVAVSVGDATAGGAAARAIEGDPVRFVVQLSRAVPQAVEVFYRTGNETGAGAATAGTDYTAAGGRLRFAPGAALAQTITVATTEDDLNEGTESFTMTLSGQSLPHWAGLAPDASTASGVIEDDDAITAAVSADSANVAEGEPAKFTVALGGGISTAPVVVAYAVAGTATEGRDYTAAAGSLTIGTGSARGTITVATRLDGEREPEETLEVRLTAARTTGRSDCRPRRPQWRRSSTLIPRSISIADAESVESDEKIEFELRLLAPSSIAVAVSYRTEDGTATAGQDYQAAAGASDLRRGRQAAPR